MENENVVPASSNDVLLAEGVAANGDTMKRGRTRGAAELLAGRDLRRDHGGPRGAGALRAGDESPGAKRPRTEHVQTRSQLLRRLSGGAACQPRESDGSGEACRGDSLPEGPPSLRATSLLSGDSRNLESDTRAASSGTVTTRQQLLACLRTAGGRSTNANSTSARVHRTDAGDAQPPAPPAVARYAAWPRYPSTDPRATRPG